MATGHTRGMGHEGCHQRIVRGGADETDCEAQLPAAIHGNSQARAFFHSCGNVHPVIKDMLDIGAGILNPVQVSAGEMAGTARLREEFGSCLSFRGGLDARDVLPTGTTGDTRAEVGGRIADLAPGGGDIAAAVPCIQPDAPAANMAAMCGDVRVAGRHPIMKAAAL